MQDSGPHVLLLMVNIHEIWKLDANNWSFSRWNLCISVFMCVCLSIIGFAFSSV